MSINLYREITPYSDSVDRWNNVTINAGAAQSTLQDIKLPEGAGSFTYHNSGDLLSNCSNRFIYWRTSHDVIELVEISLDVGLRANQLRLRFQNTPILPGVSFHENFEEVVILIATVSAIHKLIFPHPNRLERDSARIKKKDAIVPSIFHDTTEEILRGRSCYFVLNHVSLGNPLPHTSCSWLDSEGNATFLLANNAGSVLMMVLSDKHGVQVTKELMKTGSIFRLFNGLVPSVIKSNRTEVALSIICHQDASDVLVYSLFSDLQIRIWSHKKQEYIYVDSVVNFDAKKCLSVGNFTANQCQLRKSETSDGSSLYLGVFVPILSQKIFYIFKQISLHDRIKLDLVSTLDQNQHDLVDFCIGAERLWTMCLSSENQPIVLSAIIDPSLRTEPNMSWMSVDLEPRVSRTIDFGDSNPQDTYIREIFKAGRFLPTTISKAVSIYNSMKNTSFSTHLSLKVDDLKSRVIEAVENEILLKTGDMDPSEKEYIDVVAECWDRFFSYCIQYHEVGMKPLGMIIDNNTGCVIVIKKNFYSLLCPCDPLQYLVSPDFRSSSFSINSLDNDDKRLYQSIKAVLSCIDLIRESIDDRLLMRFEDKVQNSVSPIKYASELCKSLDIDSDFLKRMQLFLPSNSDIVASLNYLVCKLDLGTDANSAAEASFPRYSSFGSSLSGIGALCSGLTYFTKQRFEFCRDLLLFEVILWGLDCMESDQLDNLMMQSSIIPKTVSLVRSYYIILWCTQCDCIPVSACIQDSAFKQFCVLELPEFTGRDLTTIKRDCTISHLFFQEDGGSKARKIMTLRHSEMSNDEKWTSLFPSLVVASAALLWPLEGNMFPEFLFSQCQFLPLQEYDHLLQQWCSWNKEYLSFLVATSFLILGQHHKALKLFLNVSKEIESESFLCNRLLKGRYNSNSSLISLFCMRVIQMFEQFSLSDCVVKLVSTTIDQIEETDSHIPIFYSVLFKHHLDLGHSEEAFATLIKNPDSSRRKDCLRQLIVYLCEGKQFQKIIELSYLAFEDEVINILESRARCSDLSRNTSFYRILYALHIHHKKFRKAAAVMYELAMRFGKEVISLKGLSKQASCYLTAMNCLCLSEPEYAWIVKPVISFDEDLDTPEEMDCRNSPKRDVNGDKVLNSARPIKVEVLGLEDIQREYNLVQARLQHAQKHRGSSNLAVTPLTPEETVALLLNAALFDSAINLSKSFSLSLVPVFEAMAYKCLSSMLRSDTYSSQEIEKDTYMKPDYLEDYGNNNINTQSIWNMLEKYLFRYESSGRSELHRCVTEKLLSHGAVLPAWLRLSYQKRNFTEMINLYVSHGLLEDAIYLMIKYIKAVLGVQKEDFDLKFSLHCNSPAVWLPHTYIDILLEAVTDLQSEEKFKVLHQELLDTLDQYNKTVESVTASKLAQCAL